MNEAVYGAGLIGTLMMLVLSRNMDTPLIGLRRTGSQLIGNLHFLPLALTGCFHRYTCCAPPHCAKAVATGAVSSVAAARVCDAFTVQAPLSTSLDCRLTSRRKPQAVRGLARIDCATVRPDRWLHCGLHRVSGRCSGI